jgi:predicted nucleotidyltransferase
MNTLAQLFCSGVRAGIFRVLFGLRGGPVHLREIQRQTGFAVGTVRQDIEKLVKLGVVTRRRDGNRVCYAADDRHPLTSEIHRLVLKTVGLTDVLREALADQQIRCAFVFGSVATGTEKADSDIDLLVIGELGLRQVSARLAGVGDRLGREINPFVLSPAEYRRRAQDKEHFLERVMQSERLFVVGSPHDLAAMAR